VYAIDSTVAPPTNSIDFYIFQPTVGPKRLGKVYVWYEAQGAHIGIIGGGQRRQLKHEGAVHATRAVGPAARSGGWAKFSSTDKVRKTMLQGCGGTRAQGAPAAVLI
jgi:hypothetical protein